MDPNVTDIVTSGQVDSSSNQEGKTEAHARTGTGNEGGAWVLTTPLVKTIMNCDAMPGFARNVELLVTLGFGNVSHVRKVLADFKNNLLDAGQFLNEEKFQSSQSSLSGSLQKSPTSSIPSPQSSSSTSSTTSLSNDPLNPPFVKKRRSNASLPYTVAVTQNEIKEEKEQKEQKEQKEEECGICFDKFPVDEHGNYWKKLNCPHKLCIQCYAGLVEIIGKTRSNKDCVSRVCPFCREIEGEQVGATPKGLRTVTLRDDVSCEGYPNTSTIEIHYFIKDKKDLINRTALLPLVPDGIEAYNLLKTAWDRKLCFAYVQKEGSREKRLAWNSKLPHKTAYGGGPLKHGYPDPEYFKNLKVAATKLGIS